MKKITNSFSLISSAVILLLTFSCASTKANVNSDNPLESKQDLMQLNKKNFFFAHKGISSLYPENTMSAFKEAARLGCKGIELDIHETYDGVLVISHDESTDKKAYGFGDFKDCTFAEIQKMKIKKNTQNLTKPEHIPSLEEYCQWVKDTNIITNIEIKSYELYYTDIEKKAVKLIKKYGLEDRVVISSGNPFSLWLIRNYSKKVKIGYIDKGNIVGAIPMCAQLGVNAYHTGENVSQKTIDLCHENGLEVNAFTYGGKEVWERLFKMGVDTITTDFYYSLD
ncbi:MAG: glycerophosphodiester phosphodiesterase [Treponema sp.]|nr:glycerophosphodiester phosphodiesterase [Treponema sp.]